MRHDWIGGTTGRRLCGMRDTLLTVQMRIKTGFVDQGRPAALYRANREPVSQKKLMETGQIWRAVRFRKEQVFRGVRRGDKW
jgi:hypothetical protein